MTRQPRAQHVPLLLAALLATGCTLATAEEAREQTVDVKPGTAVHVETRNGRIRVVEGRDGKVRIKSIKKVRATTDPRKLLDQVKVVVRQKGDTLYVTAEHPAGSFTKQYGVGFELTVPKATRLSIETHNGSALLGRMHGAAKISTRNGSIKAEHVAGALTAVTRNGSIRVGGASSAFDLRSRNGSIRVHIADGTQLTGKSVVVTHNGSIRVSAPPTLSAELQAETRNGRVRSDFALGASARTRAAGKIGAGGASLALKTHNGSIRIERR
jgi:hypothetical protein